MEDLSTIHMNLGIDISVAFCYIDPTLDRPYHHTHGTYHVSTRNPTG